MTRKNKIKQNFIISTIKKVCINCDEKINRFKRYELLLDEDDHKIYLCRKCRKEMNKEYEESSKY